MGRVRRQTPTAARNLVKKHRELALDKVWETYSKHPDKATPATMHEELSYESTFNEFRTFIGPEIKQFTNVTAEHAAAFSDYLKESPDQWMSLFRDSVIQS